MKRHLRNFAAWLEPVKEVLVIVMFLWLFIVAGFLIWYITEPDQVLPLSPIFQKNRLLQQAPSVKPPAVKPQPLPGIDRYEGGPNFSKNVNKYDKLLKEAADKYQLDCTLLKAHMMAESHGKPHLKSPAGAIGLMQLMPATARAMGYTGNLYDPRISIMAGAKYIKHLEKTCCHEKPRNPVCDVNQDVKYKIAAYNGGSRCNKPAQTKSCTGKTMWECLWYDGYSETRKYVDKVKANYNYLKQKNWGC
jgi:hypothetical protein